MATFEVGKTYYFNHETIRKFKVVKKTKCYVWLVDYINRPGYTYKRKIYYLQQNIEEYVKIGYNIHLYSSIKWNRYWKIGKHPEGYQIVIKPDITTFYKMNTATLKMYKFVCSRWDITKPQMPLDLIDEYLYFEDLIKREVEKNIEDFDKDYYSLYYTSNINWDMINTKYKHNYILIHEPRIKEMLKNCK